MLKRKCSACAKKIENNFNYCPHCGASFKVTREKENFGMLGKDDFSGKMQNEIKLPFGIEKVMNSLVKQLEKQMGNMDFNDGKKIPNGIKIQIAKGSPQMRQIVREMPQKKESLPKISDKEIERRQSLPKVDAESKIRRLTDMIIYEIEAPGIQKKENVVLTELATGLEIRAYSKDKCYVKFIPLKVEVIEYYVEKEKVIIELKE